MALDIGKKRTGIAITDSECIIATGLTTILTNQLESFVSDYIITEKLSLIVVGFPRQLNNQESESVKYIKPQFNRLKKVFKDITFDYYDERFTSKIAHQSMLDGGLRKTKRQDKALVDKISAVLILQSYMDYKKNQQE